MQHLTIALYTISHQTIGLATNLPNQIYQSTNPALNKS